MTRRHVIYFAALAVLLCSSPIAAREVAPAWKIDRAHSKVTFTVTKWGFVEVEGRFRDFTGTINYDAAQPERSQISWSIRVATVDTGERNRDESLQGPDYFDAARNPEMTFVSSQVRRVAADQLEVAGTLTIRGVSKPLTVQVRYGGRRQLPDIGAMDMFQTTFTINRYDFGLAGGGVLGPIISKEVKISLIAASRPQS
jgi:polyisoprenoid-binding protein YceI